MSFSASEASSFFGPLKGKTGSFVVAGREANLAFSRTVGSLLAATGDDCTILDLDAFYASNADSIFESMSKSTTISIPEPGSAIETVLPRLFGADQGVIIIDSLNTLHHLLSLADRSSGSRKLAFTVASLSYLARTNRRAVMLTMYRRERPIRTGSGRSIADLSDITASVDIRDSVLTTRVERGSAWPGGRFSTRIP
jgi:hypothetical protein